MYSVHDWAEVHRLHEREGCSKTAIARRLSMSRNTVDRLLSLEEPPRYKRSFKKGMPRRRDPGQPRRPGPLL